VRACSRRPLKGPEGRFTFLKRWKVGEGYVREMRLPVETDIAEKRRASFSKHMAPRICNVVFFRH